MNIKTKFHRDGTVTIWDVHTRQWVRTGRPSDAILASLSEEERGRVMRHTGTKMNWSAYAQAWRDRLRAAEAQADR